MTGVCPIGVDAAQAIRCRVGRCPHQLYRIRHRPPANSSAQRDGQNADKHPAPLVVARTYDGALEYGPNAPATVTTLALSPLAAAQAAVRVSDL